MYRKALLIIGGASLGFAALWWTQYSPAQRSQAEHVLLETAMKAEFEAWQKQGEGSKDPRIDWKKKWQQFAEKYSNTDAASKGHLWALSLLNSMGDTEGLAEYLNEAARFPNSTAVPAILSESVSPHTQVYGFASAADRLKKIVQGSKDRENQAAASVMLAYLEDDESRKIEMLQGVLASHGATRAAKEARKALEELKRVSLGSPAPHFEFTDLTGKAITLDGLKGKWVLLDFWATWCPPCQVEIPAMRSLFNRFRNNEKFAMVGISLDYDRDVLTGTLKKEQMHWSQYMDGKGWDNKISRLYRVTSIPHTVLIDPEGKIRYKQLPGSKLAAVLAEQLQ